MRGLDAARWSGRRWRDVVSAKASGIQSWPSQTPPAPAIQRIVAPSEAWLSAISILNDPPYLYPVESVGCAPYISIVVEKCRLPLQGLRDSTGGGPAPPVKSGLLDREAAFRVAESARKGVFFRFFVLQSGMDEDVPGKRKRDFQAQKMRLFFLYIVMFFSVLEAHRLTLPHGLVARRPGKNGVNWVCPRPPQLPASSSFPAPLAPPAGRIGTGDIRAADAGATAQSPAAFIAMDP